MAIEIYSKKDGGGLVTPGRRLYLDKTRKRLVPHGHEDARILYCTERQAVPRAEYEALIGVADKTEPEEGLIETKRLETENNEVGPHESADCQEEAAPDESAARPESRRARKRRT